MRMHLFSKKSGLLSSFAAAALLLAAAPAHASVTLTATGSGWCSSDYCNNNNTNVITNNDVSNGYNNDWFAFTLSVPASSITSAQLLIWNDSQNKMSGSATYSSYASKGFTYSSLVGGTLLGSIDAQAADNGVSRFVTIDLNSAAITALNAAAGNTFVFGGSVSGASGDMFGYTGGTPAAELVLNVTAVPEPASALLLGVGLLGFGIVRRRA